MFVKIPSFKQRLNRMVKGSVIMSTVAISYLLRIISGPVAFDLSNFFIRLCTSACVSIISVISESVYSTFGVFSFGLPNVDC